MSMEKKIKTVNAIYFQDALLLVILTEDGCLYRTSMEHLTDYPNWFQFHVPQEETDVKF